MTTSRISILSMHNEVPYRKVDSRQIENAFFGVGLMCKHARRGLNSKQVRSRTDIYFIALRNLTEFEFN